MNISFIIPTYNESSRIKFFLESLQTFRKNGSEIILSDGGSTDDTVLKATKLCDKILKSEKGRSYQMNAGAGAASNQNLFFVHADSIVPSHSEELIKKSLDKYSWGFFKIKLTSKKKVFRVIEFFMNKRSSLTKIATGDMGLFIKKKLFDSVKGYPKIPLMEDIAICKNLRKISSPLIINKYVITSSRKWENEGIFKTISLMWTLRFLYFFKINPKFLEKIYYKNR